MLLCIAFFSPGLAWDADPPLERLPGTTRGRHHGFPRALRRHVVDADTRHTQVLLRPGAGGERAREAPLRHALDQKRSELLGERRRDLYNRLLMSSHLQRRDWFLEAATGHARWCYWGHIESNSATRVWRNVTGACSAVTRISAGPLKA